MNETLDSDAAERARPSQRTQQKVLVVGGGFFGLYLAEYFANAGCDVQLVEKEPGLMTRASLNNQARVHNGYHYPRSVLTALRSRLSFPRFVKEFEACIVSDFAKYYLLGAPLGKVSAQQFLKFCQRIGAQCERAPRDVQRLTNPNLVQGCFAVTEFAFDAVKLRDTMLNRLEAASVKCRLGTVAQQVTQQADGLIIDLLDSATGETERVYADHVFNCTYSQVNFLLARSGIELIPLKHELTEMCLVQVPDVLNKVGITVMCGPFFSVMPFPTAGLHSFSHVRYTPHFEWHDDPASYRDAHARLDTAHRLTAWRYMQKDAQRYMPILSECSYQRSLWEVKTVLPRNEANDARPILFRPNYALKGLHCIMGGKIDNVYDVIEAIESQELVATQRKHTAC